MIIKIVRYRKKLACTEQGRSETIDGQLYIEGMRICDCAENAKSAIKAGQYSVSIIKCKQHARKMPVILIKGEGVEVRAAIAKGNNPSHPQSVIAVRNLISSAITLPSPYIVLCSNPETESTSVRTAASSLTSTLPLVA